MNAAATADGGRQPIITRSDWEARTRPHVPTVWTSSYDVARAVVDGRPTSAEWWSISTALQEIGCQIRWPEVERRAPWGALLQEVRRG